MTPSRRMPTRSTFSALGAETARIAMVMAPGRALWLDLDCDDCAIRSSVRPSRGLGPWPRGSGVSRGEPRKVSSGTALDPGSGAASRALPAHHRDEILHLDESAEELLAVAP